MKRLYILFGMLIVIFFTACEDDKENPVLTDMSPQVVISPVEGANIVITAGILDSSLVISWEGASYNLDLVNPTYVVQFDSVGSNYVKPYRLMTTTELTAEIKYSSLNKILVNDFNDTLALPFPVKIRILSHIANQIEQESQEVSFLITPYVEPDIDTVPIDTNKVVADTVYLVGSSTLAGWDNTKGLPVISPKSDSVYTITTTLTAGGMKVLKKLGAWAPQWGDDGSFSGVLKYRPDEATTDPAEIPSPGAGTYKIEVDLENLTYTITPI